MSTKGLFFIALFLCVASWVLVGISDFNAGYLLERNSGEPMGTWPSYAAAHKDELFSLILPTFSNWLHFLIFILPSISTVAFRGSKAMQLSALAVIALVAFLDLAFLLSFDGGDYKGCDGCLLVYSLHLIGSIPALVFIVAGFIAGATSGPSNSLKASDA